MSLNREHPTSIFDRLSGWIVDLPWVTTLLLTVITAMAIVGHFNPHLVIDLFRAEQEEAQKESSTTDQNPVSYTHLTLPTIYSV